MKGVFHVFITAAALLLSLLLGLTVLLTGSPGQRPDEAFSAQRAASHIRQIAQVPHTSEDAEELSEIRRYLKAQLDDLGCDTFVLSYDGVPDDDNVKRDIANVYGVMKGQSEASLLLVAHLDSNPGKGVGEAPGSHGASDDGYGVSVILETLRAIKAKGEPVNTIRVLFTDGEEAGLLGSKSAAADSRMDFSPVKAVFNIESRGLRGPAILFETSVNNEAIIDFYAKNVKNPATWSLAADVYRIMPNYTDFTPFTDAGLPGLNFSNLDSLEENHTPLDRFENIDLSALQSYGDQILPVVSAFAFGKAPETFKASGDMAYFTLLPGLLIHYPTGWNYALLLLSVLAIAAYLILAIKKKLVKPKRLFFAFAVIGLGLAAAAAGEAIAFAGSLIFALPFKPTNMPGVPFAGGIAIIAAALLGIALFFILRARLKKGWRYEELVSGALLAFLALQAGMTLFLPGGAFLFGWGAAAGALIGIAALFMPDAFRPFAGFAAVWVAAPVVILLHTALTLGALGAVLLFAAFPMLLALPALAAASCRKKSLNHA